MNSGAIYDTIGRGYRDFRRPDPRIAAPILTALGDASSVVNVGHRLVRAGDEEDARGPQRCGACEVSK